MCKEELNNEELEVEENELEEGIESLTKEELVEVVYNLMEQKDKEISVSSEEVSDNSINNDKFKEGCDIASKYLGMYATFLSGGMTQQDSFELSINQMNIDYQMEVLASNEKVANVQGVKMEQTQI